MLHAQSMWDSITLDVKTIAAYPAMFWGWVAELANPDDVDPPVRAYTQAGAHTRETDVSALQGISDR